MQSTRQSSDKKSYRVILLLVVGLAAFSSAMKELNSLRELTLQTSSLIAQLSDVVAPVGPAETLVQVRTCEKILPPPVPAVPSLPPVQIPRVPSIRVPDVPDPLPPRPPRIRTVGSKMSNQKDTINLRSASNLIQKRDRRSNG